jgi:predicted dithiol-disulfide oxidoreductase (DUF899 family)
VDTNQGLSHAFLLRHEENFRYQIKGGLIMATSAIAQPKVVSRDEWLAARKELLAKEKELTRARDALSAKRRELPWVKVEKEYVFDTPQGKKTLAKLFDGRSQLIVYHFMWRRKFGEGCVGCSFLADHVDGANLHLAQHDVTFIAISRAPLRGLEAFKKRMGWRFNWVSSCDSDFNFDYHVSFTQDDLAKGEVYSNYGMTKASIEELSGLSVFYKDANGDIFHTYSSYGRGNEEMHGTYMYLDLTPKGRSETGPNHNLSDWVRHHDKYCAGGCVDATGGYIAPKSSASCCSSAENH